MSILRGKRGTWLNQFAQPTQSVFAARGRQVDYVVIKYGLKVVGGEAQYEKTARELSIPWVAERMAESGAGDQSGPSRWKQYATELANQANQPGCVGAVVNLEEADGGWHTDNGWGTLALIKEFQSLAPGKPLYASLDTRGSRPTAPYQRACASLCDGVMPMTYPTAFQQPASTAFAATVNPLVRQLWAGKDIIPTYQTYDDADVPSQVAEANRLYGMGIIHGANTYTLGHATETQWQASLAFVPAPTQPVPPAPDVADALRRLRELWVNGWHAIEQRGSIDEAASFTAFWRSITGK